MTEEQDDPGTDWNERARADKPDWMSPRMAWRAIQAALPQEAIISSDIGNNCAIGNAYPSFDEGRKYLAPGLFGPCGYGLPAIVGAKIGRRDVPVVGFAGDGAFGIAVNELTAIGRGDWPPVTQIVFRNYQWGAEKRNSTLWFDDNFVGTELDEQVSYAGHRTGLRAARRRGAHAGGADRRARQGHRRPDEPRQDHPDRGDDQPGAGRSLPPRRDEETRVLSRASTLRTCASRWSEPLAAAPILVMNAGSSSIKTALFDGALSETLRIEATGIGGAGQLRIGSERQEHALPDNTAALDAIFGVLSQRGIALRDLHCVAHRVVHGGTDLTAARRITPAVRAAIADCIPLAPLHNPHHLAAIDAVAARAPELPQCASFDTAFHATMPEVARRYALPICPICRGLRRYGFHGTSYAALVRALPEQSGTLPRRLLALHLGNGASLCAILDGQILSPRRWAIRR